MSLTVGRLRKWLEDMAKLGVVADSAEVKITAHDKNLPTNTHDYTIDAKTVQGKGVRLHVVI
uniref:Uncharacterized protein n=1 Tax=viral metagenome TaxID=1070528 RepID=A0A6M3LQQ8_9ZZZZ